MSYAKYRAAGGDCVFVENETGYLYLSNGQRYTKENDVYGQWSEEERAKYKVTTRSKKKSRKIQALRILLGHACNYSCSYCMQKDIGNPFERPMNKNTEKFIADIKEHLDISHLYRVELWGGEPFLYWKDIQEIITALDREGLEFYICTNGSPLQMKHIDFLKNIKGKVAITISHDGPGQDVRGPDPIEKRADVIREMGKYREKIGFSFNVVMTKDNYDPFAINEYFKNVREKFNIPVQVVMSVAQIYDAKDQNNEWAIVGEDLLKFQKLLREYLQASCDQYLSIGPTKDGDILFNAIFNFGDGVVPIIDEFQTDGVRMHYANCGASSEDILSVDINGDIRLCPHAGEEFVYEKIEKIDIVDVRQLDITRTDYHCKDCAIQRLCKSTCPIEIPYPTFLKNCDAEKVYYTEKQRMALKILLRQEVELEDWGLETFETQPLL